MATQSSCWEGELTEEEPKGRKEEKASPTSHGSPQESVSLDLSFPGAHCPREQRDSSYWLFQFSFLHTLELMFRIKDDYILKCCLDHVQFQANESEGLFFPFSTNDAQADFQWHRNNVSCITQIGAARAAPPLPWAPVPSANNQHLLKFKEPNNLEWVLRWLRLANNSSLQCSRVWGRCDIIKCIKEEKQPSIPDVCTGVHWKGHHS